MLPPLRKVPSLAKGHATTLGTNVFDIAFVRKHRNICFVTGQPLGYYSSWPLFALSHHVLVWYAAEQCYPGQVFRRYAILGDDIVIADDRVAMTYSALLERLGVSISLPKSLTSKEGACEFAVLSLPVGSRSLLFPISG